MAYKNILTVQMTEYNFAYKFVRKEKPYLSVKDKQQACFFLMAKTRGLEKEALLKLLKNPLSDTTLYQYCNELFAVKEDIEFGIPRYYIKDDSLFDFFKQTDIKQKEVESILNAEFLNGEKPTYIGVLGQNFSFTLMCATFNGDHVITIFTDEMNYTFIAEHIHNAKNKWVFNMAMNFLFYINAFPECVIDGVPNGVKKDSKAKVISTSEKIVSHTSVEHGFVRPHFRSGYFRHLNSDYFVNCKGQVRFIASTMVKGKAKTVLSRQGV